MEFVNCPLCGKPNPVDNKFCDFCLAHLKPGEQSSSGFVEGPASETDQNRHGLGGHREDAELPDWLKEIQQGEESGTPPSDKLSLGESTSADRQPESSSEEFAGELTSDDLIQAPETTAQPFLPGQEIPSSGESPGWLNEALIEKDPGDESTDELEETVQPEIPESKPRGTERVPPIQNDKPVGALEGAGPLAGLKGVLSSEPGIAQIRKSVAYSTKLRVTESQRNHVELLESMIADEGQPQPLPRRTPLSQQNIFRWTIAVVMLIVILWPILISSQQMPLPLKDEGSAEVNRLITQLPERAKVLLGFDYEPGLTEELEAVASPVIDHLMMKSSLMTLVSTSPSGPILAERLIKSMQGDEASDPGEEYVNLGYISGGAAGIRSFLENPMGTLPNSIDDSPAWGSDSTRVAPPLDGISQITDYDMVFLLVDDPDILRAWIEQLGPLISNPEVLTSLVIISSAQLEPVVQPYFSSSPQYVNGMVTGLRGGATYTRLTGRDSITNSYWDAYGMGMFAAAMLILVGGLGYYVLPELARLGENEGKSE